MHELSSLKKRLSPLIETRQERINSGAIPDFETYKSVVGEITGLLLALREVEDLQKRDSEEDDE